MTQTKHFITFDVEPPHRSFYAECDDETQALGFIYKLAWAESDGGPPERAVFFAEITDAEEAVADIKKTFSDSTDPVWATAEVTSINC